MNNKNVKMIIILSFTLILIGIFVFGGVLYLTLVPSNSLDDLPEGELIKSISSPDGTYTINLYLCNGGATTDYSLRGEVVEGDKTTNIYYKLGDDDAIVGWIGNHIVEIDGESLDVRFQRYDERRARYTIRD